LGVKHQVQVVAQTLAKVIQNPEGMLLRFSPVSSLAGKFLQFRASDSPICPKYFWPIFAILALIEEKLL
jgi:hypothetical protein